MKYQEKVCNVLKLTKPVRNEIRTSTQVGLILKSCPFHESVLLSKGVWGLFQWGHLLECVPLWDLCPDKYHQTLKIQVTPLSLLWSPHPIPPLVPNVSLLLHESYPQLLLSPLTLFESIPDMEGKGSNRGVLCPVT